MNNSVEQPTIPTRSRRHTLLSEPACPLAVAGHRLGTTVEKIVLKGSGTIRLLHRDASRSQNFSGPS